MSPGDQPLRRLLYIDDDEGLGRLVGKNMRRQGFEVVWAEDGDAGLKLIAEQSFAVVALDHVMPGRSGLEVLADIRRMPSPPPVIYVTGTEDSRVAVAALKAGAADYVVKVVGEEFFALFRAAIDHAIQRQELEKEKELAEREVREGRDRAEALLREVNHRVANSLQLVSTFVHMQASAIADGQVRELLRETQARIAAVAQIHRRLYTSHDVNYVEMEEYLEGLIDELRQSLSGKGTTHRICLQADPVRIPTDKAVSVGVIVAELVTNAYKYAYPQGRPGAVRVCLNTMTDGLVRLIVEDDGVGIQKDGAPRGTGLGQKIVRAMAHSLRSSLEFDPAHQGTRARIAFAP